MQVEAHQLDFQDFAAPPGSLAVISMADVFEHMPFPKAALRHAATLLRPDGLIFLSMPNGDTIVWKYFDNYKVSPYCHNFTKDPPLRPPDGDGLRARRLRHQPPLPRRHGGRGQEASR
jgi:hypothetical protein